MHVRSDSDRLIVIILMSFFYEARRHSVSMPSRLCSFIFDKQMEKQKPQKLNENENY